MAQGTQGFHPGMQQHMVHPGHPMAPGMAHNGSQPGTQPGMPPQMASHMVSAPGGQMNAAAFMGGVPPGNAQAHALQHLNPQMLQHQQQLASTSASHSFPARFPVSLAMHMLIYHLLSPSCASAGSRQPSAHAAASATKNAPAATCATATDDGVSHVRQHGC